MTCKLSTSIEQIDVAVYPASDKFNFINLTDNHIYMSGTIDRLSAPRTTSYR